MWKSTTLTSCVQTPQHAASASMAVPTSLASFLSSVLSLFLMMSLPCSTASADVWSTLVRRTAKVADDIPIRQADEWLDSMRGSRGLQDVMNSRFSRLLERATKWSLRQNKPRDGRPFGRL